jgi:predicted ATPase
VTDPGDVAATVLADLGIRDSAVRKPNGALTQVDGLDVRERLIAALSHRNALLVFDNCEHLVDATASLAAEILGACPGIRILATSREPLGVVGEMLRPVEPLALPDADWTSIEQLIAYPSIRLFAQRAAAVRPGFAVTTANAEAVVTICRALDGMPLAIELAAARMRAMSPDQVAGRLGDRFATLTAGNRTALPRHQTLRAVVDWSWDLLEEPEQVVWRRLAMFSGGATLAAVEAVCADRDFDPLTVLGALVDRSLLTMRDEEAEPRYLMLETIRAYGLMRLDEAGERGSTRAAHAAYFRDFADVASRALLGRDQFEWLGRLRADHDNLNTAIRNAIADGDGMTAIRLTGSTAWYWWISGHRREGAELVTEAFEVVRDDDWETAEHLDLDDPAVRRDLEWRATAYTMGALLAIDSDIENIVALEWFDRGVAIVDRLGRPDEPILRMVRPLRLIFRTFETATVPPSADIGMPVDDPFPWVAAMARVMRAHVMLNLGRMHGEAEADFRSALEIFRTLGEAWGQSFTLLSLSTLEAWRGEIHEAIADIHEAMRSSSRLGMWEDRVGFRTQLVRLLWLIGDESGAREELELAGRDAIRVGVPEAQGGVAHAASDLARFAGDLVTAESEVRRADELLAGHTVSPQFRAFLLSSHGFIAAERGRLDEARRLHMEAVRMAVSSIDAPVIAQMLVGLAEVALADGDARLAATVLGASTAVRGMPDLSFVDGIRVTDATIRALGRHEYEVAYARGRSGTVGQIAELVDVPMDGLAALPAVGDAIAPAAGSGNRGI